MWKNHHQWSDSINQIRHKPFQLFMPSEGEMKERCTRFFVLGLFLPGHHQKCTVAVRSTGVHITPSAGPRPSTAAQSSSDISCHGQR